jgi:hypothetical protein
MKLPDTSKDTHDLVRIGHVQVFSIWAISVGALIHLHIAVLTANRTFLGIEFRTVVAE